MGVVRRLHKRSKRIQFKWVEDLDITDERTTHAVEEKEFGGDHAQAAPKAVDELVTPQAKTAAAALVTPEKIEPTVPKAAPRPPDKTRANVKSKAVAKTKSSAKCRAKGKAIGDQTWALCFMPAHPCSGTVPSGCPNQDHSPLVILCRSSLSWSLWHT
jgi:hypothetical protein